MDDILLLYPWGDPTSAIDYLGYSFMLNFVPMNPAAPWLSPAPWDAYDTCWSAVHQNMLEYGVVSETCAQYYFGPGDNFGPEGFKMQFVPCDRAFLRGEN
jgi:hypothetical protein